MVIHPRKNPAGIRHLFPSVDFADYANYSGRIERMLAYMDSEIWKGINLTFRQFVWILVVVPDENIFVSTQRLIFVPDDRCLS